MKEYAARVEEPISKDFDNFDELQSESGSDLYQQFYQYSENVDNYDSIQDEYEESQHTLHPDEQIDKIIGLQNDNFEDLFNNVNIDQLSPVRYEQRSQCEYSPERNLIDTPEQILRPKQSSYQEDDQCTKPLRKRDSKRSRKFKFSPSKITNGKIE